MPAGLLVRPALGRWAAQWDQLVDLSPLPSPFLRSWWLTGTAGARRRFLLVVRDDLLLGGLALEERQRTGLPFLTMMGAGPLCPDHLDLLARPGHQEDVISSVSGWLRRPGTRLLGLDGIRADPLVISALPAPVRRESFAVAPRAALTSDPDTYLAARSAGFRKTLRRASARMADAGADHHVSRGTSAIRSLDALRRLHRAQWGDRSRFLPSFDRFAAGCRLGAQVDEIAVHDLAVADAVIAIMVTFEVAGRVSLYQSARRTDSPWRDATTVLLNAIIRDACLRGFTEVDFLRGDEAYKRSFAPERRQLLRLRAASGRPGRVVMTAETAARQARRYWPTATIRPALARSPAPVSPYPRHVSGAGAHAW